MTKTILITGATDGMGLKTAQELASAGHKVIVHGRSKQKLANAIEQLPSGADGVIADFSKLSEVAQLSNSLVKQYEKIDVVINNAGVLNAPNTRTVDGLDIRFAVNTYAPFLLTENLMNVMDDSGRVINVASAAQASVNLDALTGNEAVLDDFNAYSQSKLALIMWTNHQAANKSSKAPIYVSVNPGSLLSTKMVKEAFGQEGRDIQIGVDILVRAALADEFSDANGRYFDNDSGHFSSAHADAMDLKLCSDVTAAIKHKLHEMRL